MGKSEGERMKTKLRRTTVKLPEDLLGRIHEIADSKGQSVNSILNALLWESVGGRFTKLK